MLRLILTLTARNIKRTLVRITVPYYVSYETQTNRNVAGYNRIFQLMNGDSSSDRSIESSQRSRLYPTLVKKPDFEKAVSSQKVFNPKGFNLLKALGIGKYREESRPPSITGPYLAPFSGSQPIELIPGDSSKKLDLVIEAAYRQVFWQCPT